MVEKTMTKGQAFESSEEMKKLAPWLIVQGTEEELNTPLAMGDEPTSAVMAEKLNALTEEMKKGTQCTFDLYTEEEKANNETLKQTQLIFSPGEPGKPYVLVCPGGAFLMVAVLGEGIPAAYEINKAGYPAFILKYRVGLDNSMELALEDVNRAIEVIEKNAAKLQVDTKGYAMLGFSAGAHLASMWTVAKYGYGRYGKEQPKALLMGYPAASNVMFCEDKNAHIGNETFLWVSEEYLKHMCGEGYTLEDVKKYSLEEQITEDFPPVYLIHGLDDQDVHVKSSQYIIQSMEKKGIKYKARLVEGMGHSFGIGLGTAAEGWVQEALKLW
jgi:acetyl esterase/lipase